MLKSFRYLLFPISLLYAFAVWVRNRLYDSDVLKSASFNFPVICVGNLATGGTGKTPMTEYLVKLLQEKYVTATLSRGYKRKTKGFAIADDKTTALEIGDEPMQFHEKFPGLIVAVGEERIVAIPQLLHARPDTAVIILDDAFQHRAVKAGLNVILTDYRNLYTRDLPVPAGDLRDLKSSAKRADVIIVTKCPQGVMEPERLSLKKEVAAFKNQPVFFTELAYGSPYHLFNKHKVEIDASIDCLLVCGIANPKPLTEFLNLHVKSFDMLRYSDHHIFSTDDLKDIQKQFGKMQGQKKFIFTTEKDGVRLQKYKHELATFPIYVIPIAHRFLFNDGPKFDELVLKAVNIYAKSPSGFATP